MASLLAGTPLGDLLGIGAAYELYDTGQGLIDYLKSQTPGADLTAVGETALGELDFTPYSITTGFGSGAIDPLTGQFSTTLTPEQQQLQQSLFGQAATLAGTVGPTAGELYEQIQATRAPETERARLALENRLAAQGRLGTQTAMYGGTPEALAMEKAIAEQQSRDILGAQTTAGALEAQRLSNIGGLLGAAFKPEETILTGMLGLAPLSAQERDVQLGRSQLLRDLGIAGTEAEASLAGSAADLEAANVEAVAKIIMQLVAGQKK